jgi:dsRNA-specific ribonuclease
VKDKADLLEAFLGALYIDKDLQYCEVFAQVPVPDIFLSKLQEKVSCYRKSITR